MRIEKHYIEVYKTRLILIESSDPNKVENKFKLGIGDDLFAHAVWSSVKEKGLEFNCFYMVFNPNHSHSKLTVGVVAHESVHIANYIFDYIGAVIDLENDEPYCMLVEWIANIAGEFLGFSKTTSP